ncbi:MAG TPA: exodeoxyribonuclease VII small subunit [Candidatus Aphodousia gallistercoris]|nr:exodeoxyribonuclease VII small subunit [Candidatus Aphodousia gallistercoris]
MAALKSVQKLSFEEAMQELQGIVEKMRAGDMTLEESVQAYQRGKELSDRCEALLNQATAVVQKLEEGKTVPLSAGDLRDEELL